MSFMYESMMSRAPGKRKIKLQENNLLQLMDEDDDDEEDEDFQLNEKQEKKVDESSSTDSSEDSNSTDSQEPLTDSNSSGEASPTKRSSSTIAVSGHRRHVSNKQPFAPPTIHATNSQIIAQRNGEQTNELLARAKRQFELSSAAVSKTTIAGDIRICCICLKKRNPNDIVACCLCGISVHKDCFSENLQSHRYTRSQERWFCFSCINGLSPACEFCPNDFGCLRETTTGQWCHVVCARYIGGKDMLGENIHNKGFVDLSSLNYKRYGVHECILCEDRLVAKSGICVKCDAGLCRSYFHVTCAQKFGLLSENESMQNCDIDPYFVYCPLHMDKQKMAEAQKSFITARATTKKQSDKFRSSSPQSKESLVTSLQKEQRSYVSAQRVRFPSMSVENSPQPRLLTSSPALLKILNKKAELALGIDVQSPAVHFQRPSEIRKKHRVAPALSVEFASHYVDRQLRISETQERIERLTEENENMLNAQNELEQKYEDLQNKLSVCETQEDEIVHASRQLFTMFLRLKMWMQENRSRTNKFTALKPIMETASHTSDERSAKRRHSPSNEEIRSKNMKISTTGAFINRKCDECKSEKNQHLMLNCFACKRWLHIGCLDPPLTNMPRKSKFSVWQCSECAPSSGSDSDVEESPRGLLTTSEGRRQTQRAHKPPEKLMATMLYHQENQMRRLVVKGIVKKRPQSGAVNRSIKRFKIRPGIHVKSSGNFRKPTADKRLLTKSRVIVRRDVEFTKVLIKPPSPKPDDPEKKRGTIASEKSPPKSPRVSIEKTNMATLTPPSSSPKAKSFPSESAVKVKSPSPCVVLLPSFHSIKDQHSNNIKKVAQKSPVVSDQENIDAVKSSENCASSSEKYLNFFEVSPKSEPSTGKVFTPISLKPLSSKNPSCCVCDGNTAVNKMMFCQICKKHYHIWCCDPPLKVKPRATRYYWWECSSCQQSSSETESIDTAGSETTPDGRRKITRARKPPEKFDNLLYSFSQMRRMSYALNRRKRNLQQGSLKRRKSRVAKSDQDPAENKESPVSVIQQPRVSHEEQSVKTFTPESNFASSCQPPAQNEALKKGIITENAAFVAVSSLMTMPRSEPSNSPAKNTPASSNSSDNGEKTHLKVLTKSFETLRAAADSTVTSLQTSVNISPESSSRNIIKITYSKASPNKTIQVSPIKVQSALSPNSPLSKLKKQASSPLSPSFRKGLDFDPSPLESQTGNAETQSSRSPYKLPISDNSLPALPSISQTDISNNIAVNYLPSNEQNTTSICPSVAQVSDVKVVSSDDTFDIEME